MGVLLLMRVCADGLEGAEHKWLFYPEGRNEVLGKICVFAVVIEVWPAYLY